MLMEWGKTTADLCLQRINLILTLAVGETWAPSGCPPLFPSGTWLPGALCQGARIHAREIAPSSQSSHLNQSNQSPVRSRFFLCEAGAGGPKPSSSTVRGCSGIGALVPVCGQVQSSGKAGWI